MLKNLKLQAWVEQMRVLCQPDDVVICDGSREEYDRMWELLVGAGAAIKLNEAKRPNSYLVRSDLHLLRHGQRSRAKQQLDRTRRYAHDPRRPV
jgi:GTP-dependent phosphoenolpyruvate carboxykinase